MKKLFSYLLISSMVVLSSCTNYDDQFDDLNTQINTLKSQIEGFSSLSSGLTALQGTVASLQTAINNIPVTPATDISGLESSLEALSTTVAELKASLADAASADAVADIAADLLTAQEDLAKLLAQNNLFTGTLTINSESTLAAAEALGDKITIISGSVDITHNTTVDTARLQAVVDKIVTVTANVTYSQSGVGVVPVAFSKLTGVVDLDITQNGLVSFPELVSAGTIEINENASTAAISGISFPKLASLTKFETGATADVLNFDDATSVDLASLVRYPNSSLGINVDDSATITLTSLTTTNADTELQQTLDLTVTGPDALTLPLYESGDLSTDAEVVTLPKFKARNSNGAAATITFTGDNLEELHIHNLQNSVTFDSAATPNLSILDIIGTATTGSVSSETTYNAAVTVSTGTDLTTLTLAGLLLSADITATDLENVTTSGAIQIAAFKNSTNMTSLTLGHTSKIGTISYGSLTVSGNTKLTSLTADSLDDISGLVITDNEKLETISFSSLNSIGTDVDGDALAATAGNLQIHGNKLSASDLQLSSEEDAAVTVNGKFTSTSGMSDLETIIPLIGAKDDDAKVQFDALAQITPAAGGTPITAAPGYTGVADLANEDVNWAGDNAGIVIYQNIPGDGEVIEARYQRNTNYFTSAPSVGVGSIIKVTLDSGADYSEVINGEKYTSLAGYDSTNPETYMDDVEDYINKKLSDGGESVTVEIANDVFPVYTVKVDALSPSGDTAAGLLSQTGVVTFKVGSSKLITATVGTGAGAFANDAAGLVALVAGMVDAINTNLTTTWDAVAGTGSIELTPQKVYSGTNVAVDDIAYAGSAPTLGSFSVYSASNSNTTALVASQTIAQVGTTTMTKKWRITATNSSTSVKEDNLEIGQSFLVSTAANTLSFAALTAGQLGSTLSSTDYQLDFQYARERDASGVTAASSVSLVSWL